MNKSTNIFFLITKQIYKFNVNSKMHLLSFKIFFALHKIYPFFEELQVFIFPNMD
jgi:hypothetical protein